MHHGMLSCGPDDPLREVAATMANHRVHAVLIIDRPGGRPIGVVSDEEVIAAIARGDENVVAGDAARGEPLTVSSNASVRSAARMMTEHHVSHLVVVEGASGYPAGVVSTLDVTSVFARR